MSANHLLYEIIRGVWCLDISNITGYAPIINKILSGERVYQTDELKASSFLLDDNGRKVKETDFVSGYSSINMIGELMLYGGDCSYGAEDYVSMLDRANENPRVKGILMNIDGPGGSVSAINPFNQFKSRKKKPVIGLVKSACSAHLWAAMEVCDYIIATDPISGKFGSVGVMCTLADIKGAYEAKGVTLHEIYAPESEHKNESFRLALEGKYDMIKTEELSPIAIKFQNAVREARPNLKEEVGVLTGKTYFAEEAKEIGLIDAIGGIPEALAMIELLNNVKYKS